MNVYFEPHALTPYYYSVVRIDDSDCVPESDMNYTEYNLYCLRTRLQEYINKHLSPTYNIQFVPIQRGERIYISILLSQAGERPTLSSKETRGLEKKIKEITTVWPTYLLLYTPKNVWEMSLLRYLPVDPVIGSQTQEGSIYCDLSSYPEYTLKAELLYSEIIDVYRDYYQRGAVVCDPVFAEEWALIPDEEMEGGHAIYLPTWQDYRFAPDRVAFLLARMAEVPDFPLTLKTTPERQEYLESKGVKFSLQGERIVLHGDLSFNQLTETVDNLGIL